VTSYLLRADVELPQGEQLAPLDIGIARVGLAGYLGQAGVVLATDDGTVRAARQHIWAEPLDQAIRVYLRDAVSAELGYPISADTARRLSWDYRVDVRIDQLHGSLDGEVTLVALWSVMEANSQQELGNYRFESVQPQPETGYDSTVATQKLLLSDLAAEIAASLEQLDAPGSAE
jgi:uncharacterized lipoprotein YmbA